MLLAGAETVSPAHNLARASPTHSHALQTHSVLLVFIQAIVLNPEVQKRAQAEIDRVVGYERLPDFDDRTTMSYIGAVSRETLRFYSIVPLSEALDKFVSTKEVWK